MVYNNVMLPHKHKIPHEECAAKATAHAHFRNALQRLEVATAKAPLINHTECHSMASHQMHVAGRFQAWHAACVQNILGGALGIYIYWGERWVYIYILGGALGMHH